MAWKDNEGNKEPPFIKLYLEDLGRLNGLTAVQRIVLDSVMRYCTYGNDILLSKKLKGKILMELGVADSTFKNALGVLVKKAILFKGKQRGVYTINPSLAFKGKINDRASLIVKYNESGERSMSLEVLDEQ